MNVLSLFDGMSCGQITLNNLGIIPQNYFASEVDDKAIYITQKNFPNTIQLGSVTQINIQELPPINFLMGGSPCTNLSLVGDRTGLIVNNLESYLKLKVEGYDFGKSQSYLFWEYVRILKEIKPKYFLLENVKMNKKNESIITETLGVKPILIDSSLVSAHMRKRLYWTNIPNIVQPEDKGLILQDYLESGYTHKEKAYCLTASYAKASIQNYFIKKERHYKFLGPIKVIGNTFYLHDGNVVTINPVDGVPGNKDKLNFIKPYVTKLTPREWEKLQGVPVNYTSGLANVHRYKMLGNGWQVDTITHIIKNIFLD